MEVPMSDAIESQMAKLDPVERSRTYHFPSGEKITIEGVSQILVRPSGSHRLVTQTGVKWIIASGWIAIEIDVDNWSV
jgi:hypothetical protein